GPATKGPLATSDGQARRPRPTGPAAVAATGPGCQNPASTWSSIGARRAACTCFARCWPGRATASFASPATRPSRPRWPCWPSASRSWERGRRRSSATALGVPRTASSPTRPGPVAAPVVPPRRLLRFAANFVLRPDLCGYQRPEPRGVLERQVGNPNSDLNLPADGWGGHAAQANRAARVWGLEVNAKVHSETQ